MISTPHSTPYGPAALHGDPGSVKQGPLVVLLHGAGTSSAVPVLVALQEALLDHDRRAVRLDQPYIVSGRRTPPPARALDIALDLVLDQLPGPFVLVGRSSGSRVACRAAVRRPDVRAVVALGFPLHTPAGGHRGQELAACRVPVLVVQGQRDRFASPEQIAALHLRRVKVHPVAGADHELRARRTDGRTSDECVKDAVGAARGWLLRRTPRP